MRPASLSSNHSVSRSAHAEADRIITQGTHRNHIYRAVDQLGNIPEIKLVELGRIISKFNQGIYIARK